MIQGWAEYQRKLKALEATVRGQLLKEAALAGGQIVLDAAQANAPRDTGRLAAGMTMRLSKDTNDLMAAAEVGPSRSAWYGFLQEFGTRHHRKQPFLGPALESNRERIFRVMREIIIGGIQKVAA